ncbi:MAG: hypothetical protein WCV84_04700 [Patescibacteria group bacterium]
MALIVTINGTDRSAFIDWESLNVQQIATSEVDSAQFKVKTYGVKKLALTVGDEVLVYDGATAIFGGTIVRVANEVLAGNLTTVSVECVSHERTLDRYLVAREIQNKNGFYVINTIITEFVNRTKKVIASGESTETWTTEDGTVAANTTAGEFILESQSRKFTATAGATATARFPLTLDLTIFDNGLASTTDDLVTFWYHVDTVSRFASLRLRLTNDAPGTYTNYFETTIVATPRQGWNQAVVAKSAFTSTGSPVWSAVTAGQCQITAGASGTLNVSIDDIRLVKVSEAFTQQNVTSATAVLGSVKFNYEQVSQALKQIAEALGFEWYITPSRDIFFYLPSTIVAPFALTDTSGNFVWDSLRVESDVTNIKNQVFVRGGEYDGSTITESMVADGSQLHFKTPYKMKNVSVKVAGASKTVGVDNLDDPTSYDCLYNFNEKTLKFRSDNKPAATKIVAITGNPKIPVIVKKSDASSIATHGIYEYVIVDKSITTLQGGRDRASAELKTYRDSLVEGGFKTYVAGLRAGQTISVNVAARSIADSYRIRSVTFRAKTPTEFEYEAAIVSTRTFGIIDYLLGLLRKEKKQIDLNDNEVSDLVQDITEMLTITDVWLAGSRNDQTETITSSEVLSSQLDHGTIFVFGPYTPTGFVDNKRVFIFDGSILG